MGSGRYKILKLYSSWSGTRIRKSHFYDLGSIQINNCCHPFKWAARNYHEDLDKAIKKGPKPLVL